MKKTLQFLLDKKHARAPISMVTAYDFPTARALDEAEVDTVLVGDSLGTNCLGYASEREVTIGDMVHHTSAVRRGIKSAFVIADMPYGCADDAAGALANASKLTDCGADCVKIEGWGEKADIIRALCGAGIAVCAHIGYNPQIHDKPAVFGKSADQAAELMDGAKALCGAGAGLIVLEMVPAELSEKISAELTIPTIGIGSGNRCDGQVLVVNDLLGISPKVFKHVRAFADLKVTMREAFKDYISAVGSREFPGDKNSW